MALKTHEQFLSLLEGAKQPLIALPEHATADEFATAFACAALLSKLGTETEIVTSGGAAPKSLSFLSPNAEVRGDLPNIRKMTLHVNAKDAKIDQLSYDVVDGELQIHLFPKTGAWQESDVKISTDSYRYDLILAIGSPDLESFGQTYASYADFFFETPIINIDHQAHNEQYGQLNLVDVNAVACGEVCHDLFSQIDDSLIDEEVATYLLTGMIAKTKSFRTGAVSPKTLKVAGSLMARGARRDEIVEKLYKTRTVETLRLWGRALARLKSDAERGMVWTMLTRQDFSAAGAEESDLESIIDELLMSSPHARVAAVFYEHPERGVLVMLHAEKPHDALALGAKFKASGTREEARLALKTKDIVEAEKQVITHLRENLTS